MFIKTKSENSQVLRNLIPLTTLSKQRFEELASAVRIEEASKGAVIFRQGDSRNEFVYLLVGEISLQSGSVEMDSVEGGSEASRFALAHQIPRKVDAIAKTRVRFVRIASSLINQPCQEKKSESAYQVNDMPKNSSKDWMTTLLQSPIFQRLPPSHLQKVIMDLEEVQVAEGESVIRQGDPGDFYYIIKRGECVLSRKPSPNAKEIKLAKLRTCDTFGEDALISENPRNVSITMLTEGTVLRLPKDKFLELIKDPIIRYVDKSKIQGELDTGGLLIDVRSPDEYEQYHLPGSKSIPFFSLRMQLSALDANHKIVLVCKDGKTSEAAAFLLLRHRFDAVVIRNGIANSDAESTAGESIADSTRPFELNTKPPISESTPPVAENRAIGDINSQDKQNISILKTQLSDAHTSSKRFEQDVFALRLEKTDLSNKLQQLKNKAAASEEQRSKNLDSLQKERAKNERLILELESVCQSSKNDEAVFQKTLNETEAELSEQRVQLSRLRDALNKAEDASGTLAREIETLKAELEAVSKEKTKFEDESSKRQATDSEKIAALESLVLSHEQTFAELEKKYSEEKCLAGEDISKLEQNRAELIAQCKERTSTLEEEIIDLRKNLAEMKEQASSQQAADAQKINDREESIESLKTTLAETAEQAKKEEIAASENISKLSQDIAQLTQQHSEGASVLEQEIEALNAQLKDKGRIEKELEELETLFQSREQELETRLSDKSSEKEALQVKLAETAESMSTLELNFERLNEENSELRNQFQENSAELEKTCQDSEDKEKFVQRTRQVEEECEAGEEQLRVLEKQNTDLKSVIEKYIEQAQSGGQDEEIASLNAELEMIREQAQSDFDAMTAKLNEAQNQTLVYKTALEQQQQETLRLRSELSHPLAVSADFTPTDDDIFAEVKEPSNKQTTDGKNAEKKSGFRTLQISLLLLIALTGSATGFILGTEQGQEIFSQTLDLVPAGGESKIFESDKARFTERKEEPTAQRTLVSSMEGLKQEASDSKGERGLLRPADFSKPDDIRISESGKTPITHLDDIEIEINQTIESDKPDRADALLFE